MYASVDIGGTKTLLAVFTHAGELTEQIKFPTPSDYQLFLKEIAINVEKLSTKSFDRLVVAAPAKVDREHGIAVAFTNLPWFNVPVLHDLEKLFQSPGQLENDTKVGALYAARALPKPYHKALYITVSTGISAGLVTDNQIDPDFADAEAGKMLLEHQGKLMRWEEFASGKAIVATFGKRAGDITDPGEWYTIARNLAVGVINLIAVLTPEIIIFGGGVGSHFNKFADRLREELKIYENPLLTIPPLVKAEHPEEAVIYGCYELAKDHATTTR